MTAQNEDTIITNIFTYHYRKKLANDFINSNQIPICTFIYGFILAQIKCMYMRDM